MSTEKTQARADELLRRYPYDDRIDPSVYEECSPERLRGVPPGMREALALIYARNETKWLKDAQKSWRRYEGKPEVE